MTADAAGRNDAATRRGRLQRFERGGLEFDVVDGGPRGGEAFVLLHGFPGNSNTWRRARPALETAGYRTLAPDQRGYSPGARPRRVASYAVEELVLDVLALADAAGLNRFHLVGHDWGGAVAWDLAARHPERLDTLTVLSTPHPGAMAESMTRSLQPLRSSYALAWQVPTVPELIMLAGGGTVLRTGLTASGLPPDDAAEYVARMRQPGALTAALNWYRAAGRRPRLAALPAMTVPTLYVWSNRDTALGGTAARRTGRHVSGPYEFIELDGVSHWIPETVPARTARLLIDHAGGDLSTQRRAAPG
jgi:pimeloyl-ACP methyl ester carboxylesterase